MAPSLSRPLMMPRSPLPPNPPAAAAKSSRRHRLLPAPRYVTPSVTRQHGAPIGCPAPYGGSGPVFLTGMLLGAAIAVMALPVAEWQGRTARLWAALEPALRERLAEASLHDAVRLGCDLLR